MLTEQGRGNVRGGIVQGEMNFSSTAHYPLYTSMVKEVHVFVGETLSRFIADELKRVKGTRFVH